MAPGIFAKTIECRDIIGVDISPTMLEIARTRMERVYEGDIFNLKLEKNSVDNIITLFVLADYAYEKKQGFIKQIYSTLKPNGRFFFSAYSPNDGYMGKTSHERASMRDKGGNYELHLEDISSYENMFTNAGFKIEKIEKIDSKGAFVRDSKKISFDREFIVIEAST